MGVVFWLFSYVSGYIAILLLALSISSGLYLLAEIAEEYPTLTGKCIKYLTGIALVLQVVLWLDGLPAYQSIVGLLSHVVYASMLKQFPFVQLYSVQSLLSVIAFFACNIVWLQYFIETGAYEMLQVLGFFVLLVWAVPCALFISVSLNDNSLPGMFAVAKSSNGLDNLAGRKKSFFRVCLDYLLALVDGAKFGAVFSKEGRRKRLN